MSNSPQAAQAQKVQGGRILFIALLIAGLIIFVIAAFPAGSRATRLGPPVQENVAAKHSKSEFVPGHVLVRYKDEPTAKRQQKSTTTLTLKDRTIPVQIERFDTADMITGLRLAHVDAEDTLSAIEALRARSDVLYAVPDLIMHPTLTPNDPCFPLNNLTTCGASASQATSLYGLNKIGAPSAWNTTTGSNNVVVGVIDEGIDINHPDLQANIWTNPAPGSIPGITGDLHGYNFYDNNGTVFSGNATEFHGSHVAGTIGAVGNNGVGVTGVNWQVKLMPLKFIGPLGGATADAIRACSYAKQMRDLWVSSGGAQGANVRVLNNSWGPRRDLNANGLGQPLFDAIDALNQSGILFVVSAGNDGIDEDVSPAYPTAYGARNLISVAATTSSDTLAFFSDFGAHTVTLGAPGTGILSTEPSNKYVIESGTSMAAPHVAGAAALLLAQNPNLTVQQLRALLIFNGDPLAELSGKTVTGRRLNVGNSMTALLTANDTTAPGAVTNFHVNSQTGRSFNLGWTTAGDDGPTGQASLYELSFTDAITGAVVPLQNIIPPTSGTGQTLDVKVPYAHTFGTITMRELDDVGNEGTPVSLNVSISFADGNPYATAVGKVAPLSTGGTHLNFNCDDCYKTSALPFSFPFFGQNYGSVTISSNGNIYFTPPNPPAGLDATENAADYNSWVGELAKYKMISGLWDDLYLKTDQRADADVYMVQPDSTRVIFRWQGVPCNPGDPGGCQFGAPINFEIELRNNGVIQSRYGSGNTNLVPIVGISGGDTYPFAVTSHTSEDIPISLTNAQQVTYIPRAVLNPMENVDFFVSQHYRDFLGREPDPGGEAFWIDQIAGNASNTPAPCPNGDVNCVNQRRINVSNAFFFELEYQQTAAYVYRVYREAFGNTQPFANPDNGQNPTEANKIPLYSKFKADREQVIGGANLAAQQLAFANAFVQRPEFISRYPANLTLDQFVTAILTTVKNDCGADLTATLQSSLVALGSRGAVVYRLANDDLQGGNAGINNRLFIDAEYNRAFVFGEYSGYLRRDSDIGGFLFWLGQVNSGPLRDTTKQRNMVCSFITSLEFQFRFSVNAPHSNGECQ